MRLAERQACRKIRMDLKMRLQACIQWTLRQQIALTIRLALKVCCRSQDRKTRCCLYHHNEQWLWFCLRSSPKLRGIGGNGNRSLIPHQRVRAFPLYAGARDKIPTFRRFKGFLFACGAIRQDSARSSRPYPLPQPFLHPPFTIVDFAEVQSFAEKSFD